MSPTVEDRYRDIIEAIEDIEALWQGKKLVDFSADRILRLATERLLEILCEATRRLPDSAKLSAPEIEWRRIIDFGNVLRHAYHMTQTERVWVIIERHLPPLKAFALRKLSESET